MNLLWQASNSGLKEIAYDHDHRVPSWSWMAYSGGIKFLDIRFERVEWIDHLRFDEESHLALVATIGTFQNCVLQPDGRCYAVLDSENDKVGSIQYDLHGSENLRERKCAVIGRTWGSMGDDEDDEDDEEHVEIYYVIVVRSTGIGNEYRRIGTGWIQSSCVKQLGFDVRII